MNLKFKTTTYVLIAIALLIEILCFFTFPIVMVEAPLK